MSLVDAITFEAEGDRYESAREDIVRALRRGANITQACAQAGISRESFYRYRREYPAFDDDVQDILDRREVEAEAERIGTLSNEGRRRMEIMAEGGPRAEAYRQRELANNRRRYAREREKRWEEARRNPVIKACLRCGSEWCEVPLCGGTRRKYCSPECFWADEAERRKAEYQANRETSRACSECQVEMNFELRSRGGRLPLTCSDECRKARAKRLYREKKRTS